MYYTQRQMNDGRERAELRAEVESTPMFNGHIWQGERSIRQRRALSTTINKRHAAARKAARLGLNVSRVRCPYVGTW